MLQQSLTSELNASNQHFPPPALPIGTNLIPFICPKSANVYRIHHPRGLKLLTRLQLGLIICVNINFDIILMIQLIHSFFLCGTNNLETSEHFLSTALPMPVYAVSALTIFRNNNILLLPSEKP